MWSSKNFGKPITAYCLRAIQLCCIWRKYWAGKTTLATKIAEDFNAKTVLERFADNPFLPKFYKDQNRYAFPLEPSRQVSAIIRWFGAIWFV
jgi:hypothetical protein